MAHTGELTAEDALDELRGSILDIDTHEMIPVQLWVETFGSVVESMVEEVVKTMPPNDANKNNLNDPNYAGDTAPIARDTAWTVKGVRAPGSVNMERRLEHMDVTGISRQTIYPTGVGLLGTMVRRGFQIGGRPAFFADNTDIDTQEYSDKLISAYNEWAVTQQAIFPRLQFVAVLLGDTPDQVMSRAKSLVGRGIRMLMVVSAELLGGHSPAHDVHDPLWEYLAANNVPVTVHIGNQFNFLQTEGWGDAPFFEGYFKGIEFDFDPWHLSVMHLSPQNYLATMIVGGVFHRHPSLRFGVTEYGAYWVGPMADMLDLWYRNGGVVRRGKTLDHLPERPSTYLHRNVRVSPFDFEDVAKYIRQYDLGDVLCFGSDYPHVEGGKLGMAGFAENLAPLGFDVMQKFFSTNAQLILPRE